LTDIRGWILGYFVFMLFFITTPPIEKSHNWRQTLTNTIARNYAEDATTFKYPMVDHGGIRSGIIGAEFPLYNYTIAKFMQWFGFKHWYGRLINLIITCIGIGAFSGIISRLFNKKMAFYASFFLLFSIWFTFGRKIMPDTIAISFVLLGIYAGMRFLSGGKWIWIIPLTACIATGLLIKLPAAVILAPFSLLILRSTWSVQRRILVALGSLIAIIPAYYWYFKWMIHLNEFGFSLYFPRTLQEGWLEISELWALTLNNFVFHSFFSYLAFAVFCLSLFALFRKKNMMGIAILMITTVVFIYFILKTGLTFPLHSYYMIPFVPVMALVCGYGISTFKYQKYIPFLLLAFSMESLANQHHDLIIRKSDKAYLQLEQIADSIASRDFPIICNGDVSPTLHYFLNRRGWSIKDSDQNFNYLDSISQYGAEYLYLYRSEFDPGGSIYSVKIFENEFLRVFKKRQQ
jgi:hypothetical protein